MNPRVLKTTCVVAGGGPAGIMTGYLLARSGVDVTVLEKHADFLRDFRGDTVHPSTMALMHELGLLEEFLRLPHRKVSEIGLHVGGRYYRVADFSRLPVPAPFIALMPQWDLLEFLARAGARHPSFSLRRSTEVTDLIEENGRIVGVRARDAEGELEVRADLVVGADGRHSRVRERAGLTIETFPVAIDVLWMRLPRVEGDPPDSFGYLGTGRMMVLLDRGEYWQCAYLIRKDGFPELQAKGLAAFRADIAALVPFLAGRVDTLADWDAVKLLTVRLDRLRRWWRPGLLCIGDAAHAMSPVGGVGINLAVQDAVATANILAVPLAERRVGEAMLAFVQERRTLPMRVIQRMQRTMHARMIEPVLAAKGEPAAPWFLRLLDRWAGLRGFPARLIGLGVNREHVRSPARD